MYILSIDTSTKNFSLAVSCGEKVVACRNVRLKGVLSSSIVPGIRGILKKSGLELSRIDGFAVGLGPGSFTSLRVGLATVKGLAFAVQKPVVGIPSLDILAMNLPGDCPQICTLSDAKRKLVYACCYQKKGLILKKKGKYLLEGIEDVLKRLKGGVVFIGDGVPLFKETIRRAKGIVPVFAKESLMYPRAGCMVHLALERFKKGKTDDVSKLTPLYLYPKDCQVQRSKSRE